MKKLFTKIVGISLGIAMAIGVGVGVTNSKSATPLKAEENTVTWTATSGALGNTAISESTASASGTITDSGSNSWDYSITRNAVASGKSSSPSFQGSTWIQLGSNNVSVNLSFTTTAITGTVTSITVVSASAGTHTLTATVGTTKFFDGETIALYSGVASESNPNPSGAGTNSVDCALTGTNSASASNSNPITISFSAGTRKALLIRSFSITYTTGGGGGDPTPTVDSVLLSGNMSTKSYHTAQSWNNTGLTATVTMSDSSVYGGDISWTYSPATPAAAVIANSKNEVTGGTVTATASAGGQSSDDVATSGISVSIATVAQLTAATPASGDLVGVIARGIVSQIQSVDTTTYHNATYFISDDGTTTNQYEVFRGKGVDNADINNANDIKVGDTVLVYGDVYTYNETKEFKQGNYLLSLERPALPDITITENNFSMNVGDDDVAVHATANNIPDGGSVTWESSNGDIATVSNVAGTYKVHAVAAGSVSITAKILNSSSEVVASNSITVTVIEQLLSDGDTFIIKATYNANTYYMTGVTSNLGTVSTTKANAMVFTAVEGTTPGQFQFKNGDDYLSYSGSSNAVYTTEDDEATSTLWTAVNNGSGAVIESVNVSGRKLQFNYNSGNSRFACYASAQTAPAIELVVAPEVDEVTVSGDATADANNAVSIVKDFMYEVTYVDPQNVGSGAVNVTVLNSSDGTEGASVTTAPLNGGFSVTFTASDTYTVTVTSAENPAKSDSTVIAISNIYVPVTRDFELYEGTEVSGQTKLAEGDYVINYSDKALKASITSNRAENETVSIVSDVIATGVSSIVWHIAPAGDYYTIYNAAENKYLAATESKNQAQLLADGSGDNAKWTVTIENGKFEFENLARSTGSNPDNKWLRNNGSNGWACYSTSTGNALSLYRLSLDEYLGSFSSLATLHGTESEPGVVSSVSIKFGARVTIDNWNSITAAGPITNYGVKLFRTRKALSSDTPVQDGINAGKTPATISKGSGEAPSDPENNCYSFTVTVDISSASNYDIVFCAAPFVEINGVIYFLDEIHFSVNSLAEYYIDHDLPSDFSEDGLLSLIA